MVLELEQFALQINIQIEVVKRVWDKKIKIQSFNVPVIQY